MAKQGTLTATPRLRFPEFRHQVGFDPTPLGHAFGQITNGKANAQDHEEGGAFPLFDRSEVIKASSKFAFDSEAVILPGEGMSFRPRYFEGKFDLHQRAYALMDCHGHGKYFYYALDQAKAELALKAVKSTVLSLRLPIIEKFVVYAPSNNAEQQKIADCLTTLDEVISAQGRKVGALKEHKCGLLQQLFPREGEGVPRLRFPEFRDAPEWAPQALDTFIEEFREKSTVQDEHEVLTSARSGLIRQRDYYDNERIAERDNIGFNVIPPNYMTYRSRSDDRRFFFNENSLNITGIISTYYPVFRIRGGINKFFIELLAHHAELVGKRSVGTSQTVLSLNELRRLRLPLPVEAEQRRIASCLSSLDAKITAESDHLAALQTHKQGLMQQLFPVRESVRDVG